MLRASNPNLGPGTIPHGTPKLKHVHGGSPINPNATINVCGRDATGRPDSGPLDTERWHPHNYYLGKIAHFAIVSDALSEQEIQILFDAYQEQFGFNKNYPDCLQHSESSPAPATAPTPSPSETGDDSLGNTQTASRSVDIKSRVVLDLAALALSWIAMLHHL